MTQRPVGLPYLPDYAPEFRPRWPGDDGGFSAEQMYAYATAAMAAERAACALVCDGIAQDCADAIRARSITADYPGRDKC